MPKEGIPTKGATTIAKENVITETLSQIQKNEELLKTLGGDLEAIKAQGKKAGYSDEQIEKMLKNGINKTQAPLENTKDNKEEAVVEPEAKNSNEIKKTPLTQLVKDEKYKWAGGDKFTEEEIQLLVDNNYDKTSVETSGPNTYGKYLNYLKENQNRETPPKTDLVEKTEIINEIVNPKYEEGTQVTVKRSDGTIEKDWWVMSTRLTSKGKVIRVHKGDHYKTLILPSEKITYRDYFENELDELNTNKEEKKEVVATEPVVEQPITVEPITITPEPAVIAVDETAPVLIPIEVTPTKPESNPVTVENKLGPLLKQQNEGFLKRMSNAGKNIMSRVYETLYKVLPINRLVAKVEITYNQFWIDNKESGSVDLKAKIDGISIQQETFADSKKEILSAMEDLKKQGVPGHERLQIKIKEMEKQEAKMAFKKDKIQSKVEEKENKIKIFTNKRDQIANKMIAFYDKKLSPIEEELSILDGIKNRQDLMVIANEARCDEGNDRINFLKEKKAHIEEKLMVAGTKESEIKNLTKYIEKEIISIEKRSTKEKEGLERDIEKNNDKMAGKDKRANPYKDRRNEFIRIKEGRPIEIKLEDRNNLVNKTNLEQTNYHKRGDGVVKEKPTSGAKSYESSASSMDYSTGGKLKMTDQIEKYNKYLETNSSGVNLKIDQNDLFTATKLSGNNIVAPDKFKEILKGYYKAKRVSESSYLTLLNNLG